MENVIDNRIYHCINKDRGCGALLKSSEKEEHESTCDFHAHPCPFPRETCLWQGPYGKAIEHIQRAHKNTTILNGANVVYVAKNINVAGSADWFMVQNCFDNHFMLVLEKQQRSSGDIRFAAIVQLIGSREQAERFYYRIKLCGNGNRFFYDAVASSSQDGVTTALMTSDCFVFDTSIAKRSTDINGNLRMYVKIASPV